MLAAPLRTPVAARQRPQAQPAAIGQPPQVPLNLTVCSCNLDILGIQSCSHSKAPDCFASFKSADCSSECRMQRLSPKAAGLRLS